MFFENGKTENSTTTSTFTNLQQALSNKVLEARDEVYLSLIETGRYGTTSLDELTSENALKLQETVERLEASSGHYALVLLSVDPDLDAKSILKIISKVKNLHEAVEKEKLGEKLIKILGKPLNLKRKTDKEDNQDKDDDDANFQESVQKILSDPVFRRVIGSDGKELPKVIEEEFKSNAKRRKIN